MGTAVSATAGSSFFGPSGLISIPTTETLGMGEFHAFANYTFRDGYDEAPVGVNVGLGFGLEVGATRIHETGSNSGNEVILNAKYVAFKGNLVMPQIAVGAINLANNKDFLGTFISVEEGEINPYVVASKSVALPGGASVSLSAGYIAGSLDRGMYGASLSLSPKLTLMADYVDNWSKLSFGARYQTDSGLGLQASLIDGNFAGGISYTAAVFGN